MKLLKDILLISILLLLIFPANKTFGKMVMRNFSFNTFSSIPSQSKGSSKSLHFATIQSVLPVKSVVIKPVADDPNVNPAIIGIPLVYKNPFRMNEGAHIGYELSKDLDVEIQVFNIFAHLIYKTFIASGDASGGKEGWNEVPFNREVLNGFSLSPGVYFYLIIHSGKILGKGKMAIVP